ncbi:hypothetical protein AB7M22_001412 [Pseudomonas sp. ADAK2 TE3594]
MEWEYKGLRYKPGEPLLLLQLQLQLQLPLRMIQCCFSSSFTRTYGTDRIKAINAAKQLNLEFNARC